MCVVLLAVPCSNHYRFVNILNSFPIAAECITSNIRSFKYEIID